MKRPKLRPLAATGSTPQLGQYPLGSPTSRAAARELLAKRNASPPEGFRVVVSRIGVALDLERSSCVRYRLEDGALLEHVDIHGSVEEMTDAELEAFIRRWPIDPAR